jgi:Domain of unknown function (DUF4345)
MNGRMTTIIPGAIIVLLGAAGLVYPERVLGLLGFSIQNASHAAAALGEVRATYGGIFLVMGIATLVAAADPPRHRGRARLARRGVRGRDRRDAPRRRPRHASERRTGARRRAERAGLTHETRRYWISPRTQRAVSAGSSGR